MIAPVLLSSKEPKDESEQQACEDARYNWEVESEIAFGDMNISRKPAQPGFAKPRPQQSADDRNEQSCDNQKFSNFVHVGLLRNGV